MRIYDIIDEMTMGKSMFDIELRVTYYARVSSLKDSQLNSLENQKMFFEEFISKNKKWKMVPGYIDEGIRGESVEKREEFLRMIEDSKNDKFDLILTKEISRFARNTVDSLQYTRQLLRNNVGVFFINDNITTLSRDGELRLTIMSSIYQDEVRKLSSRIKFGHKQSIKNGVVLGNSRIYGYDKVNGKLVINESEAEMVRKIYNWYVYDNCSANKIEKLLAEDGYKSRAGGKIAHTTINTIIKNPKYKGYYCGNKVVIDDYMSQKQRFLPESEWITWKDETGETVPQIIDEKTWELANIKFKKSSEAVKNRVNGYSRELWGNSALSHKIYCTHCNAPYWRDTVAGNHKTRGKEFWKCSGKKKNGTKSCNSISLYLDDIEKILSQTLTNINNIKEETFDQYIEILKTTLGNSDSNKEKIKELEMKIEKLISKKELNFELYSEGNISKDDFLNRDKKIGLEIENNEAAMSKYKSAPLDLIDTEKRLIKLKKELSKIKDSKEASVETMIQFVDQMRIGQINEDNSIDVEIVLFNGDSVNTSYNCRSSGHIFKKMIESYENSIK